MEQTSMQKVYFQNSSKQRLAGTLSKPAGSNLPCVIICHGLASSKDNKQKIQEAFGQAGIASLAFDFHGHGESEGKFEEFTATNAVDDARSAINFVSSLEFTDKSRIGLMGHSFGGLVVLAAAEDKRVKALVASAPVTDFAETMQMLSDYDTRLGNTTVWKERGFTHYYSAAEGKYLKLNYLFYEDAIKYDAKNIAKRIKCPVLLIHGTKDRLVPLRQSENLMPLLKSEKELKVLDCDHVFEEKDLQSLVSLSKDWFLKRL